MYNKFMLKKILLVEDDEFLHQLYLDLLKTLKVNVVSAKDGQLALNFLNTATFDLVLLDVMLPKIDGITVFNSVKESGNTNVNKIVFMTNLDANSKDVANLKKAKDFLIKSDLSPDEFIRKVLEYLELK